MAASPLREGAPQQISEWTTSRFFRRASDSSLKPMDKITEIKAKLYDLSTQHAQTVAQVQQMQAQAQQQIQSIERECVKLQGQLELLDADTKETEPAESNGDVLPDRNLEDKLL